MTRGGGLDVLLLCFGQCCCCGGTPRCQRKTYICSSLFPIVFHPIGINTIWVHAYALAFSKMVAVFVGALNSRLRQEKRGDGGDASVTADYTHVLAE